MATNRIEHGTHLNGLTVQVHNKNPGYYSECFVGEYYDDGNMFVLRCANGAVIGQKENWTVEDLIESRA